MRKFNVIYNPSYGKRKFIFTHLDLKRLHPPVNVSREKPIEEEIVFNAKKRSEVIDYEDEEYVKLKNKESCPLLLEDVDNLCFIGKLQTVHNTNTTYFTFTREGNDIYITPIKKWYRFTQKISSLNALEDDEVTKATPDIPVIDTNAFSDREEIDYEDEFDDDEGEDFNFKISEEKKLSKAGKKLRNIVENLEKEEDSEDDEKAEGEEVVEKSKKLTKVDLKAYFGSSSLTLRELIKKIKQSFSLDTEEKNILKEFISESCAFEVDPNTNEKILKLK